ncbi:MAG: DnaD domain protein [Clostridia bacterium]|nr:DnaD domain protein [Clostridia bacterium]
MVVRFSPEAARREITPVDNLFIAEYLPHASGRDVQVYLYGLMQCYHASASESSIADALGLPAETVLAAFVYWQEQGLVRIVSEKPLTVEYRLGELTESAELVPVKYHGLVTALASLVAPRQFGMRELKHVYDWIEVYGLDEGAALELVSHCMDVKGRRVSINYMSAVAQTWSENGIRTRADAVRYVEDYALKKHGASAILREWNKTRKPTKAEMALYDKWTEDWGFDHAAILAALPRITAAGTPSFTILDEQLESLRRSNAVRADDIRAADSADESERAFARLLFARAGKLEPASRTQRAQLSMYLNDYGMPRELLLYAADCARGANEPFGLMKRLLNDWHAHGADTVEKAEAHQRQAGPARPGRRAAGKTGHGYQEHSFSEEELNKLLVDLDQEL